VGPRAGLDRCGKSRPQPGFDARTVQPVASRYTDYATRPTPKIGHMQIMGTLITERPFVSFYHNFPLPMYTYYFLCTTQTSGANGSAAILLVGQVV